MLLASLDTRRPAAMQQLKVLGEQVGVDTLPIVATETPVEIARRAEREGRLGGYDVSSSIRPAAPISTTS